VGVACFHAVVTRRARTLLGGTPLVYARLLLPKDVDLRGVLEQPSLFSRRLALAGSFLRVLTAAALAGTFAAAGAAVSPIVAGLTTFVCLAVPETLLHVRGRAEPPVTPAMARLLAWLSGILPGGRRESLAPAADDLRSEVLTTIDGREVFDPISRRMLSGLLGLKRRTLRRIMTPRSDVIEVGQSWSVSRAVRHLAAHPHHARRFR
jgi:CBS domain containing-hemolysin-like protein